MSSQGVLSRVLATKRQEAAFLRLEGDAKTWQDRALAGPAPRDFYGALCSCARVPVIAEIKRASPSAGRLNQQVRVDEQARAYQAGGAAALSVLTDSHFFAGSLQDLAEARAAVDLPVLCKDFIIDPLQLYQARVMGADAVLLIAAALDPVLLGELYAEARSLGLTALIEVHAEEELEPVLALQPSLVGINNRDLKTLQVDLQTCLRLRRLIPPGVTVVAESGIQGPQDVTRLLAGGLDAFLVGTHLMRAPDPRAALAALVRVERT